MHSGTPPQRTAWPAPRRAAILGAVLLAASMATAGRADALGVSSPTGSMSTPRVNFAGAMLVDGRVLVAGGRSGNLQLATSEVYDPATGAWTTVEPMGVARTNHTATLLDGPACSQPGPPTWCGKVLVAGGSGPAGTLASAELFDPATGTWVPTGGMAKVRRAQAATPLGDGRVLVTGGRHAVDDPGAPASDQDPPSEVYDPASGIWSAAASMHVERMSHTATRLADGRILVTGGNEVDGPDDPAPPNPPFDNKGTTFPSRFTEIYEPAADAWTQIANLSAGREGHTASLLPDGGVIVSGGRDFSWQEIGPRQNVDLLDVATGAWDASGTRWLEIGRADHTATALPPPDGRVLAIGGADRDGPLASVQAYTPAAGSWSWAGPLTAPRTQHLAFLLAETGCAPSCGRILVVGGASGTGQLASAELYDPGAPTSPGPVTGLTARALSDSRLELSFGAAGEVAGYPPAVDDYIVKQSATPITTEAEFSAAPSLCGGTCRFDVAAVGDPIRLSVSGLDAHRAYHYSVRPVGPGGATGPFRSTSASTLQDRTAPGPVGRLRAKAESRSVVRLSFVAPGEDGREGAAARDYVVRQSGSPLKGAAVRRAAVLCKGRCRLRGARVGERLTLRVRRLRAGSRYFFSVEAKDAAGNLGPRSCSKAVRTPGR